MYGCLFMKRVCVGVCGGEWGESRCVCVSVRSVGRFLKGNSVHVNSFELITE